MTFAKAIVIVIVIKLFCVEKKEKIPEIFAR